MLPAISGNMHTQSKSTNKSASKCLDTSRAVRWNFYALGYLAAFLPLALCVGACSESGSEGAIIEQGVSTGGSGGSSKPVESVGGSGGSGETGGGGGSGASEATAVLPVCSSGISEACDADVEGIVVLGERTCSDDGSQWGSCLPQSCPEGSEPVACDLPDGTTGIQTCAKIYNEGFFSTACYPLVDCSPGDSYACGEDFESWMVSCFLSPSGWVWDYETCDTPLVIAFDDEKVEFTAAQGSFDLSGRWMSVQTAWVSSRSPWLVLDLNHDGMINNGTELFGTMTVLPSGKRAKNGFEALAMYDDNGDGVISAQDKIWSELQLWADENQDRAPQPSELRGLDSFGIQAISVKFTNASNCDDSLRACEGWVGSVQLSSETVSFRTARVVDVVFQAQ